MMFISHKNNILLNISDTEWFCRCSTKNISKAEYWVWLATITTQDENGHNVVTYPSEDFTIVECTDENVQIRLAQLGDYISEDRVYNIKWSDSKVSAVIGQDDAGNDITIETHLTGDDTAKDARVLVEKWDRVRTDRNRRLIETDYLALKDNTLSTAVKTYRQGLRDVPTDNADPDNITWPDKP